MEEAFSLKDRTALVTGASRGIGAAIAKTLGAAGAAVCVNYAGSEQAGRQVVQEIRATGSRAEAVQANLAEEDAPERLHAGCVEALGEPGILVSNVAVQLPSPWPEITPDQIDEQVRVNFQAALRLIQFVTPAMQKQGWGRILTIGSVQEVRPHPDMLIYSALKNAQTAMVRSLAKQLAPHGITVNNLAPGVILTDRNRERLTDPAYRENVLSNIPANHWGSPEDCAGPALLLCSEAGRYVTGQNLFVDGGMSL